MGNVQPAPPTWQLRQIVRSHEPDESRAGKPAFKGPQRVACITCGKTSFDISSDNPSAISNLLRGTEPLRQAAHTSCWFKRIARRHHKPQLL